MRTLAFVVCLLSGIGGWVWFAPDPRPLSGEQQCPLDAEATLVIACTDHCGPFNRRALERAADALSYNIHIINDLSGQPPSTVQAIDGLLIPGGADIAPRLYISALPASLQTQINRLDHLVVYSQEGERRDPFEYGLLQHYFTDPALSDTPILGICRGMQLLTVASGIPLYIDIATELGIPNRRYHFDRITVSDPQSDSAQLLGTLPFYALELHHQALNLTYFQAHQQHFADLRITAISHEGRMAEIIEWYKRPVIGTQFHPELSPVAVRAPLFRWFLERACHKRNGTAVSGGATDKLDQEQPAH